MYVINPNTHIVNEWADTEINQARLDSGKYGVVLYTGAVEEYNGVLYEAGFAPVPEPLTLQEAYNAKLNEAIRLHDAIAKDSTAEYSETEKQSFYLQQAEFEVYDKVKTETPEVLTTEYNSTYFAFCYSTALARGVDFNVFMDKVGLAITKNKAALGLFMGAKQKVEDMCKAGLANESTAEIEAIDVLAVFNAILATVGVVADGNGKLSLL